MHAEVMHVCPFHNALRILSDSEDEQGSRGWVVERQRLDERKEMY